MRDDVLRKIIEIGDGQTKKAAECERENDINAAVMALMNGITAMISVAAGALLEGKQESKEQSDAVRPD
jgi:hypothetical protein